MPGFSEGPNLAPLEVPWPSDWQEHVDETCVHMWESCWLTDALGAPLSLVPVIRCSACHVPRCGLATDPDPCMDRRHHKRAIHSWMSDLAALVPDLTDRSAVEAWLEAP